MRNKRNFWFVTEFSIHKFTKICCFKWSWMYRNDFRCNNPISITYFSAFIINRKEINWLRMKICIFFYLIKMKSFCKNLNFCKSKTFYRKKNYLFRYYTFVIKHNFWKKLGNVFKFSIVNCIWYFYFRLPTTIGNGSIVFGQNFLCHVFIWFICFEVSWVHKKLFLIIFLCVYMCVWL